MKAIFYILALLAIGGAAFFSYDNLEKFKVEKADKETAIESNRVMTDNVNAKQVELDEENAALEEANKLKAETIASIENLEAKEKTFRRDLGELEGTLEEQKAKFANLQKSLAEVNALVDGAGVELDGLADEVTRMEDEKKAKTQALEEKEALVEAARKKVESNQSEISRLADRQAARNSRISRNSMESVVSAVNDDWGFVVIGAGRNTGFTPQTKLLVKRGGRLIAEVEPSSIEPSQTIAEINDDTLAPGVRIQPGDRVILSNPATN